MDQNPPPPQSKLRGGAPVEGALLNHQLTDQSEIQLDVWNVAKGCFEQINPRHRSHLRLAMAPHGENNDHRSI